MSQQPERTTEEIQKRLLRRQRALTFIAAFVVALLFSLLALLFIEARIRAGQERDAREQFCGEVEKIRTFGRESGQRQLDDIPKPGTPGYAYYLEHPDELVEVKRRARATVATFSPPLQCERYGQGQTPIEGE